MYQRLFDLAKWFGVGRILASACGVVVVVAGSWWVVRVPPPPIETAIPFAVTTVATNVVATADSTNSSSLSSTTTTITVYVTGEVAKPGVYVLALSSRVIDAVAVAGGATKRADLVVVNLALPLVDAAQVYIPRLGENPRTTVPRPHAGINLPPSSSPRGSDGSAIDLSVDLNTASLADLDTLPGVGQSTAQAIIDYRLANGPFLSVDDLLNVRGIGPSKLAAIRVRVRV